MRSVVNSVWIGPRLSVLEQLTIKLYQRHGHPVRLWLYGPCDGVPEGTLVRDAREILPQSSVFGFNGHGEGLPNNGKGWFSQWSDLFQMTLLHREGGVYSQLDVSCLEPLDYLPDYAFAPHGDGVQTCLMKLPPNTAFARDCIEGLSEICTPEAGGGQDWIDTMLCVTRQVRSHGLSRFVLSHAVMTDFAGHYFMVNTHRPRRGVKLIHWSNAWSHPYKEEPREGTYYWELLRSVGLT